jgi:hypothetical protein
VFCHQLPFLASGFNVAITGIHHSPILACKLKFSEIDFPVSVCSMQQSRPARHTRQSVQRQTIALAIVRVDDEIFAYMEQKPRDYLQSEQNMKDQRNNRERGIKTWSMEAAMHI